jgi:hypothetical protein
MIKYLIIHNKHEGCYEFQCYEDHENKRRLTSITINPPKIFMFHDKEQAHDFFNDYINEVDIVDPNCKNGEEVEHVDYCTCGIVELDDDENPILFYNKRNQIFFMEVGAQTFLPPQNTKNNIDDMNLTNRLIRRCRHLDYEQKQKYIELGKVCEESMKQNTTKTTDTPVEESKLQLEVKVETKEEPTFCIEIKSPPLVVLDAKPEKKQRKPKESTNEKESTEPKAAEPKAAEPKVTKPKTTKPKTKEPKN